MGFGDGSKKKRHSLVGGLAHFLFSPIVGMMIQSDVMGWLMG